jgi:glycosyltransferase involved in cell wall biosynthesis
MAGVPVIVHTYHGKGFHVFDERWKEWTALRTERFLASIDTGNVVVSSKQRDEFLSLHIAPASRLELIRYGLDLDPLLQITATDPQLAAEIGVAPETPLVGVVGRLVAIKGQHVFLQAAATLIQGGTHAHFVLAGDGEDRSKLEMLARTLGIRDRVHFLGWRKDIPVVLAGLRLVVLPTVNDFEGTPLAVIEALAAARAVIATDVGGVAEVIRPRETGLLVPPRDPARLAGAIQMFLENPAFAEQTAHQGRTLVSALYRRERMIDETERYFHRLLTERAPRLGAA